jgi:hypothetical protein
MFKDERVRKMIWSFQCNAVGYRSQLLIKTYTGDPTQTGFIKKFFNEEEETSLVKPAERIGPESVRGWNNGSEIIPERSALI